MSSCLDYTECETNHFDVYFTNKSYACRLLCSYAFFETAQYEFEALVFNKNGILYHGKSHQCLQRNLVLAYPIFSKCIENVELLGVSSYVCSLVSIEIRNICRSFLSHISRRFELYGKFTTSQHCSSNEISSFRH